MIYAYTHTYKHTERGVSDADKFANKKMCVIKDMYDVIHVCYFVPHILSKKNVCNHCVIHVCCFVPHIFTNLSTNISTNIQDMVFPMLDDEFASKIGAAENLAGTHSIVTEHIL